MFFFEDFVISNLIKMSNRLFGSIFLMLVVASAACDDCPCGSLCGGESRMCINNSEDPHAECKCGFVHPGVMIFYGALSRTGNKCGSAGDSCNERSGFACCKELSCVVGVCVKNSYLGVALAAANLGA